ncbi:MAG: hypothetical protein KGN34_13275 [Sphingomonadales bacterium]|nr:hypothetical protein [Sphingomonadales bacterium]
MHRIQRMTAAFLRLLRCESGNTLMIAAAAVLPLLALSGSAIDIGRTLLVRSRLQHACDTSVLAFRRSMVGTNIGDNTESIARSFFSANFNANRYGSRNASMDFSVDSSVIVHGTATVSVPLLIMGMFGNQAIALTAKCDAQMQLPNTDIMFVLDTTGSMTDANPGDTVTKIAALRSAVIGFYKTVEQARPSITQVRYGFVPYANTVNVGMLLKREWMVDSATYQSRAFDKQVSTFAYNNPAYTTVTQNLVNVSGFSQVRTKGSPENCTAPANTDVTSNYQYGAWTPNDTAVPRQRTVQRTVNGSTYSASMQSDGSCLITENRYNNAIQTWTEVYQVDPNGSTPVYMTSNYWNYKPVTYDVSALKGAAANGLMAGGAFDAPILTPATNRANPPTAAANATITWNSSSACIEERKTLRDGEAGTAYDMDVDMVPSAGNADTQWRPYLPGLLFGRNVLYWSGGGNASNWSWSYNPSYYGGDYLGYMWLGSLVAACPSPARKLQSTAQGLSLSTVTNYVNGLTPRGDTYHDIGFLWGLRLLSAQGLFAAENSATPPNGGDISRHLIFMTDGQTDTRIQEYDAYGLSALDRRRTSVSALPTDARQNEIVEARLQHYCSVAKAKGITVWVVAFGTELTQMLSDCASAGRAYQADNAAQLNTTFADIINRIAQLRLTA